MAHLVREFGAITTDIVREKLRLPERYTSRELTSDDEIRQARQLATLSFKALGKIPEHEIGDDGILLNDPLLPMSHFFGTIDRGDTVQATARLLWTPDTVVSDLRLPLDQIKPEYAEYLQSQEPGSIAELGSLAKGRGVPMVATLKLLRSMWAYADEHDIETLVCGLEPKILPRYQSLFGESLKPLTNETIEFPGIHGPQRPLLIDVRRSALDQKATKDRSIAEAIGRRIVAYYVGRDAPGVLMKSTQ